MAETFETDSLHYEAEVRAKYDADDLKDLLKQGKAMPPSGKGGDPSYPIADEEDLDKAIKAVGRGNADHDAIRLHVIAQAGKLGLTKLIPDNWNMTDGTLKQENSADNADIEARADAAMKECPTCEGTGTIKDGSTTCPTCEGDGEVAAGETETDSAEIDSENRAEPTDVDPKVAAGLQQAKEALDAVMTLQESDPDNTTDPDDVKVMDALKSAEMAIKQAILDQAADGAPDPVIQKNSRTPLERGRAKKPRHRSGPAVGIEVRRFAAEGLEVRSASDGSDTITITGSPIVYNTPYEVRDMFGTFEETMLPGVVAAILPKVDCRFLFNHQGLPLARTTSGTLTLTDTADSLNFTAELDARQQLANDLTIAIERGDVSQMSCGFIVASDQWNAAQDQRSISALADLLDVSGVTYPASPTTDIQVAQRMMMSVPVESRARIRKLWTFSRDELREGKVLSSALAEKITNAAKSLGEVLDAAGLVLETNASDDDSMAQGDQELGGPQGDLGDTDPSAAIAQDGTGSRNIPETAQERRDAALSFGDQQSLVYQSLCARLEDVAGMTGGYVDIWIVDLGTDWVVWESWGSYGDGPGMWRLGYSIEGEEVAFDGEPEQVAIQTQFVSVTPAEPETPLATSTARARALAELELIEIRKRHVAA